MDDLALRLFEEIRATPLCVACGSRRLACTSWDFLKATRALITGGHAQCAYEKCQACSVPELIVRLRSGPRWDRVEAKESARPLPPPPGPQ
jgi:hypothetical protein